MEQFINNMELYLQASVMMALTAAFAGGVLASLTPCVYPMIPITAGYVGERNLGGSKLRGAMLSLVYVFGLSVTYAAMGMFAALTGRLFGEFSTNPWAFIMVANIVILLGLSMFDLFTIPVTAPKTSIGGNGIFGIFLVGILSGFVAGPCTAPVLGVMLAYVATTHNILFGGALLFVFAVGMSLLLILVGTFSGVLASLPRSGIWMEKIKKGIGVVMILLGEYFLITAGQYML